MRKQLRGECVRARRSPGVCTAFQARCAVLCPCQASRCDQTLSECRWLEGVMEGERHTWKKQLATSFMAVVLQGVHSIPPQTLSFISVPDLPDWSIIRKQHNWFMTLHHVCPSLLFCFTPAGRFLSLGINFRKRFINPEGRRFACRQPGCILHGSRAETCLIPVREFKGGLWKSIC